MTSSFSVDDLITKRLTIDGKRIEQLELGALVKSDSSYGVGIGTDTPRLRLDISGTNGIRIPVGITGERPQIDVNDNIVDLSGVLRYNTTLNQYEAWALDGWQAFGGSSLQLYTKEQGTNPTIKLTKEITTYGGNDDGGIIEFCLKNQSDTLTYQARISALNSTSNAGYGSLVFSTSGGGNPQERMRIDHTGNVGIIENLTVGGDISGNDASFNDVSGVNFFGGNFFGDLQGNAATVVNGPHTNITGVGTLTSSPETNRALHVSGNIKVEKSGAVDTFVELISNNKKGYLLNNDGTLKLNTEFPSNNLILQGTGGNVGIGTSSPEYPLHIKGGEIDPSDCQLMIENQSYNKGIEFRYKSVSGTQYNFIQAKIYTSGDDWDTKLHFSTAVGTANTPTEAVEVMTLDSAGNVGIGTNNPGAKLEVFNGNINIKSGGPQVELISQDGKDGWTLNANVSDTWRSGRFRIISKDNNSYPSGAEKFTILRNGNVGIGTTNPGYKLEVNGSLYYASGGLNGSDDRIKHNEQSITNALSIISKLKPKHYIKTGTKLYEASHNFQLDASGNPLDASGNPLEHIEDYTIETGIIAQEIKNIPELKFVVYGEEYKEKVINVYKKDASGNNILDASGNSIIENTITEMEPNTLCVDYNSIHCTHIAATQELDKIQQEDKTKLLEAEAKIAASEAKIAASEAKITALENTLADVLARLAALE